MRPDQHLCDTFVFWTERRFFCWPLVIAQPCSAILLRPIECASLLRYDNYMDTHLASQPPSILDQLLTPVGDCLTPEVARHLVDLHASDDVQARLETLADKSTAGQLSAEERAEYATAVAAIEFISVLQAKARRVLRQSPPPG